LTPTGFAHSAATAFHDNDLGESIHPGAARSGAVRDNIDPELQQIIDAWPGLPRQVQQRILAMVEAAGR
jgi:hypothetical protein